MKLAIGKLSREMNPLHASKFNTLGTCGWWCRLLSGLLWVGFSLRSQQGWLEKGLQGRHRLPVVDPKEKEKMVQWSSGCCCGQDLPSMQ